VVKFADTVALAPNKENYEKFMAKFTKAQSDKTSAYAQKNYPGMREITGEYQLRLITIK
jgi:anion-transporting  ArsA/GET3 family ATPase